MATILEEWKRSLSGQSQQDRPHTLTLNDLCGNLVKEQLEIPNCTSADTDESSYGQGGHNYNDACNRAYELYVPTTACDHHHETNVLPLVFAVHCFGCPASSMRYWIDYAEAFNFVLVIPHGIDRSFNAQQCCGAALEQNIDDVGFFRDLVNDLTKRNRGRLVSPDLVYGFGWSNGGYMVVHAAHIFRAIAPVSGYQVYDDPAEDLSNLVAQIKGRPIGLFLHHSQDDKNVALTGCCSDPTMPQCCCGLSNFVDQCQSAVDFVRSFGQTVNHCQGEEFVSLERIYQKARSIVTCYQVGSDCRANTTYCIHSHGGHFKSPSFEKSFPMTGQIGDFFARDACENVGGGSWSLEYKNCDCSSGGDNDIDNTASYCLNKGWKGRFDQPDWANYSPRLSDDGSMSNVGLAATSFAIIFAFFAVYLMAREEKKYRQFKSISAVELTDFSVDPIWEDDNDLITGRPNLSKRI